MAATAADPLMLTHLFRSALPSRADVLARAQALGIPAAEAEATAGLVTLIAELSSLDRGRRVHGAADHRYRLLPPVPLATVEAFEATNGVRLPRAYRRFVLLAGGGGAGSSYGLVPFPDPSRRLPRIAEPFPGVDTFNTDADADHEASRRGVLYLGTEGCDMNWYLVVTGPARGEVWFDPDADGEEMRRDAPDFDGFVEAWAREKIETLRNLPLVKRVRRGMSVADLEALFGRAADAGSWTAPHPDGSVGFARLPRVPALFLLDADGRVLGTLPRRVL